MRLVSELFEGAVDAKRQLEAMASVSPGDKDSFYSALYLGLFDESQGRLDFLEAFFFVILLGSFSRPCHQLSPRGLCELPTCSEPCITQDTTIHPCNGSDVHLTPVTLKAASITWSM